MDVDTPQTQTICTLSIDSTKKPKIDVSMDEELGDPALWRELGREIDRGGKIPRDQRSSKVERKNKRKERSSSNNSN